MRKIITESNLEVTSKYDHYDIEKLLNDENNKNKKKLKKAMLEDKKHLLYADKISDEAFKQGLARVGLFNGIDTQNELQTYVANEFQKLKKGENILFDLREK